MHTKEKDFTILNTKERLLFGVYLEKVLIFKELDHLILILSYLKPAIR